MVHHEVSSGFVYREREHLSLMREGYCSVVIQGVVVSRLDRLSRSQEQLAILLQEMEARNITLYCAQEQPSDIRMIEFIKSMYNV